MTSELPDIDMALARKVLTTIAPGLCRGLGRPEPGAMCIEAAVCYAMGLPHTDKPPCVHPFVRHLKINLNDLYWPSQQARAEALKPLAICQLGSDKINGDRFSYEFILRGFNALVREIFTDYVPDDRDYPELRAFQLPRMQMTEFFGMPLAKQLAEESRDLAESLVNPTLVEQLRRFAENVEAHSSLTSIQHALLLFSLNANPAIGAREIRGYLRRTRLSFISAAVDALRICKSPGVALWDELMANGEV